MVKRLNKPFGGPDRFPILPITPPPPPHQSPPLIYLKGKTGRVIPNVDSNKHLCEIIFTDIADIVDRYIVVGYGMFLRSNWVKHLILGFKLSSS